MPAFTMTLTLPKGFNEKNCSMGKVHFGIGWFFSAWKYSYGYDIGFAYEEDRFNDVWRTFGVDYNVKAFLMFGEERISIGAKTQKMFKTETVYFPLSDDVKSRLDAHLVGDNAVVMVEVKIEKTIGVRQMDLENFAVPKLGWTDVILEVGGKLFHVNKMTLSNASPVFDAMLNGNFIEATADVVIIRDADPDVFETFLQLAHHCTPHIEEVDIPMVLELGDRFYVEHVKTVCEHRLMNGFPNSQEKLENAEKLGFEELMKVEIRQISEVRQMDALEYSSFGPIVNEALFVRGLELDAKRSQSCVQIIGIQQDHYSLEVDKYTTVGMLAREVAMVEGNPLERQCLQLDDQLMECTDLLSEYNLEDFSRIKSVLVDAD